MRAGRHGIALLGCLLATACVDEGVIGRDQRLVDGGGMGAAAQPGDGDGTGDGDDDGIGDPDAAGCPQGDATCVPCLEDANCPPATPHCQEQRCVACIEDGDCTVGQSCEDGLCATESEIDDDP